MKKIPLTRGQFAIVDDDDFERLSQFRWQAHPHRTTNSYYACRTAKKNENNGRLSIRMHREIMKAKRGEQVDHINRNTLDNRKENLRFCTGGQNCANKGIVSTNTSGFKGVAWKKSTKKWMAYAKIHGKRKHIGYYDTALEAAVAHDKVAVELHGEFALTNEMLGLIHNVDH